MAALSPLSGLTALTELVPADYISQFIQPDHRPASVAQQVAWIAPYKGGEGGIYRFPRWSSITSTVNGLSATAESDTATGVGMDTNENSATPAVISMMVHVSDQVQHDAKSFAASLAFECTAALSNRMDRDTLALATSASNTVGNDTTPFDTSAFLAGLAAFKALEPVPGQVAFIGGHAMIARLLRDMHIQTAPFIASRGLSDGFDPSTPGLVGFLDNVAIYESGNVPVSGAGHEGCFTVVGPQRSGLGVVISKGIGLEVWRQADRLTDSYVFSVRYACTITNQSKVLGVIASDAT